MTQGFFLFSVAMVKSECGPGTMEPLDVGTECVRRPGYAVEYFMEAKQKQMLMRQIKSLKKKKAPWLVFLSKG